MSGILTGKEVMSSPERTIRMGANVIDAVKKMNKFEIGCLVVVEGRRPVGIITDKDVLRKVVESLADPSLTKVQEIISTPLKVVPEDFSVERLAQVMVRYRIKKLPVVRDGRLVGVATQTDLVKSTPALVSLIDELSQSKIVPREANQMYP